MLLDCGCFSKKASPLSTSLIYLEATLETVLIFSSFVASVLHYRAAGRKVTSVGRFHVWHTLFSFWYCVSNWTGQTLYHLDVYWPKCSFAYFVLFVPTFWLFAATWTNFAGYWERALGKAKEQRQRVRKAIFAALSISITGTMLAGSDDDHGHLKKPIFCPFAGFWYLIFPPFCLSLCFDAIRLAMICHRRVSEELAFWGALRQTWKMFAIAVAFCGAFISATMLPITIELYYIGIMRIFAYCTVGGLMTLATWRRKYLVLYANLDGLKRY